MQVVPNQLVELHVDSPAGMRIYRTRVEDVYDDLVIMGAPLEKGAVIPIRVGNELKIEFKLTGPDKEGRFRTRNNVEKRFRTSSPLLELRLLGEWQKTQEGMFVRVPVHLDAVVVPLQDGDEELPSHTALILNLSGGGILLRSDHPFQIDDEVRISFRIGSEQIVSTGYVERFVPGETGQGYGFVFLDIPEAVRKAIIQFVYKRHIEDAEHTRAALS